MIRVFIFVLVLLSCTEGRSQSVEAVLRALQERYTAANFNTPRPWPPFQGLELDDFPEEGSLTTLDQVIFYLNQASIMFDETQKHYVACDVERKALINTTHRVEAMSIPKDFAIGDWESMQWQGVASIAEVGRMNLPSVGRFDLSNWRTKLIQLASNIHQLKAVEGVFTDSGNRLLLDYPHVAPVHGESVDERKWRYFSKYNSSITIQFPYLLAAQNPIYNYSAGGTHGYHWSIQGICRDTPGEWPNDFHPPSIYATMTAPGTSMDDPDLYQIYTHPAQDYGKWLIVQNIFEGFLNWEGSSAPPEVEKFGSGPEGALEATELYFKWPKIHSHGDLTALIAGSPGSGLRIGAMLSVPESEESEATDAMELSANFLGIQFSPELIGTLDAAPLDAGEAAASLQDFRIYYPEPFNEQNAFFCDLVPSLKCFYFEGAGQHRRSLAAAGYLPAHIYGNLGLADPEYPDHIYGHFWRYVRPYPMVNHVGSSFFFDVELAPVSVPNFTPFYTPNTVGVVPYALGDVELTAEYRDFARIHLGRGKTDKNQVAYLTSRPDGFASPIFNGSPSEFDVMYEYDSSDYGSVPFGGNSFDSLAEFTEDQEPRIPWPHRFSYLAEWYSPRLKQVRGGDILVEIDYQNDYKKTLKFYWTNKAEPKQGGFFVPNGTAFKEVVIENPLAPDGFPIRKHGLHIKDGNERFYRVEYDYEANEDDQACEKIVFGAGPDAAANAREQKLIIPHGHHAGSVTDSFPRTFGEMPLFGHNGVIKVTNTTKGTPNLVTKTEYGRGRGWPLDPREWQFPAHGAVMPGYLEFTADGRTRRIDFEFQNTGNYKFLSEVNYSEPSGSSLWSEKDRVVEFDGASLGGERIPKRDQRLVNGTEFITTWLWDSDQQTATSTRQMRKSESGGEPPAQAHTISTTKEVFSDWYHWKTYVSNAEVADQEVSEPFDAPHTLVKYPGGYRVEESVALIGGEETTTVRTGWTEVFATEFTSTIKRNRFGGLMESITTGPSGVLLEHSTVPESKKTGWGAPTEINLLRGDKIVTEYQTSGHNWGELKKVTDPFGAMTQYTSRDWSGRLTGLTTPFGEVFSNSYADPLELKWHSTGDGGYDQTVGFTATGDLKEMGSTLGVPKRVTWNEGGGGSVKIGAAGPAAAEKIFSSDPSGFVSAVGGGLGSRGGGVDFRWDTIRQKLCVEITPQNKDGSARTEKISTYYDARGRVVEMVQPRADGNPASEAWIYDDVNRAVTYLPGPGPRVESTLTEVSEDGAKTTLWLGGRKYGESELGAQNGKLVVITRLNNDSTGAVGENLEEVSRTEWNPSTGETLITPWNIAANQIKIQEGIGQNAQTTVKDASDQLLALQSYDKGALTYAATMDGEVTNDLILIRPTGRVASGEGSDGGKSFTFSVDKDGRFSGFNDPAGNRSYTYDLTDTTDSVTMTLTNGGSTFTDTITRDRYGDLTVQDMAGEVPRLDLSTSDTADGLTESINGSLTVKSNLAGAVTSKDYVGGSIIETTSFHPDGTLESKLISGSQGSGPSVNFAWPNPYEEHAAYTSSAGSFSIKTKLFKAGPRQQVIQDGAMPDRRDFLYAQMQQVDESHSDGVWSGYQVNTDLDTRGRLKHIHVTGPGVAREFRYGYDGFSRLNSSETNLAGNAKFTTVVERSPVNGQIQTITRKAGGQPNVVSSREYHPATQLLTSASTGSVDFDYPTRDGKQRITSRTSSMGGGWTGLSYDTRGQLEGAQVANARNFSYAHNARGNRTGPAAVATHTVNDLNQITARHLGVGARGFGLAGAVAVGSGVQVTVQNLATATAGAALSVDPSTGQFFEFWTVPNDYLGGAAFRVDSLVRASLPPPLVGVAESMVYLVVPPAAEDLAYDGAGQLLADAFWTYEWDAGGRLTKMTRRAPLPHPDIISEVVNFVYDADGRRTKKTTTQGLVSGGARVKTSQMLYADWLPVLERRWSSEPGAPVAELPRRWFQWGPDQSGVLGGAGGIGGLLAIHEESTAGAVIRTLLPVDDGLGNIVALVDGAGNRIASYAYGPFGEWVGGSGEIDACPFRWQTKLFDEESGHYYFGYRHYNPRLGRWLSRDPIGEEGGFNRYAYCGNDPVNRWDYLGLDEQDDRWKEQADQFIAVIDAICPKPSRVRHWEGEAAKMAEKLNASFEPPQSSSLGHLAHDVVAGFGDIVKSSFYPPTTGPVSSSLYESVLAGNYSLYAVDPTRNPRVFGNIVGFAALDAAQFLGRSIPVEATPRITRPGLQLDSPHVPIVARQRGTFQIGEILPNGQVAGLGPGAAWIGENLGDGILVAAKTAVVPEIYQASLRRFRTPNTTAAGRWEIANTGPYNYTVVGGGTKLDVDGIIGTTIQEAKFIAKPESSPFIPGSSVPDLLRTKILDQVDGEFARMSRIIADPSNPFTNVEIIINNAAAERFFLDMLKKHRLNGRVIIR